jgi:nucleoside-diphosphate-sugar epimerase
MKVFITGGSGYVGRSTITALVAAGHGVSALVRSDSSAQVVTGLGAKPVHGSLRDLDVLRAAASDAEGVIHLGQELSEDTAAVDRDAAEALQDGLAGRGTYVHTGGVWVYGNTKGIVDEDAPQNPPRITAWRAANEQGVLARGHAVLVMPGLVYGNNAGLIDIFFVQPDAIPLIDGGANYWPLVHVDDIADLYVRALTAPAGSIYAGVGQNVQVKDIVAALSKATGHSVRELTFVEAEQAMGPIAEAFALDQRLTSDRARRELGWAPRHVDAVAELS